MTPFNENTALRISIQQALVREVTPDLVAVTCGIRNKVVRVIAYFDHSISSKEEETVHLWGGDMIGHFPDEYDIHEEAKEAIGPLVMLDFWHFARADANLMSY